MCANVELLEYTIKLQLAIKCNNSFQLIDKELLKLSAFENIRQMLWSILLHFIRLLSRRLFFH